MLRGAVDEAVVGRFHAQRLRRAPGTLALPLEQLRRARRLHRVQRRLHRRPVSSSAPARSPTPSRPSGSPRRTSTYIVSATVTGLAVPSLEARVAALIGMRPDVVRVPLVGLGCVAGRRRGRPAARLPRRPPRRRRGADVGRAVLADPAARRRLGGQPGGQRALRRRRRGGGRRRERAGARATTARPAGRSPTCSPRAAGSTPTPSAPWAGTSAPPGCKIVLDSNVPVLVERYVGDDVRGFLARPRADPGRHRVVRRAPRRPEGARGHAGGAGRRRARRSRSPGTRWPGSATCPRPRCSTSSPTPSPTARRGRGPTA